MKHTEDFKREATRIALSSGLSRTRVAADWVLANPLWVNGWWLTVRASRHPRLRLSWRENGRFRLENRILREEREILKKATRFFASQKP
ncbi:helix-turn-helix, Fis-type transposase IS3/IS911 family protein [Komagataeibacter xylinus E25]|nr:helix-turn-helix, Fis-type transposase IS3/IS911 family protein [Komagataeibacter xylinus E25]